MVMIMKKIIKYTLSYALIMFLGHYIKKVGVSSIFDIPFLVLIPYNYLALSFGIKRRIEKNDDINYKENIIGFIFSTTSVIIILCIIVNHDIGIFFWQCAFLILINIIELYLIVPKKQSLESETKKNIDDYFKNKNIVK